MLACWATPTAHGRVHASGQGNPENRRGLAGTRWARGASNEAMEDTVLISTANSNSTLPMRPRDTQFRRVCHMDMLDRPPLRLFVSSEGAVRRIGRGTWGDDLLCRAHRRRLRRAAEGCGMLCRAGEGGGGRG